MTRTRTGMTVLELMIVLAIIAGAAVLVRSGFRLITKADLVENSSELAAILKRTDQLATEHAEMHRIVFDLDKQSYVVEVCQGAAGLVRNEAVRPDEETKKRALEQGKLKLQGLPTDVTTQTDPEENVRHALAVAGQHISDRTCRPATDSISGDATGKGWARALRANKGIKFKDIYIQHRDDPVTKGQVALYFWPDGSSEKAVIELTDGDETFSVLIYGLSGRVELKDGVLRDINDHMLKNVMGDRDARRENEK
jgi:type II secretory pathway pseudopilin PulG